MSFVYTGPKTREISFPLGGIGTGCIGLAGNGRLIDWEIQNRPNKGSANGFSHFAIRAERRGEVLDARVLSGDLQPPYSGPLNGPHFGSFGFGPSRHTLAGVPHFTDVTFEGRFPMAQLTFGEQRFPGQVAMQAFNPLIPLNDRDSSLPAAFFEITVSNTSAEPLDYAVYLAVQNPNMTAEQLTEYIERVVRPRLADARFFFDQDRRQTLASRVPQLASVVYHAKLGSQGERVERVRAIARDIAAMLGTDVALVDRAALLAKTDLLTDMVGEFPELQGVMGAYYARHDGEPEPVAVAIREHYQPRFAGDALPSAPTGLVLALADKLETLAGLFGIGQLPTGDKDPFALRRHALGVIRMLIEAELPLSLDALLRSAFAAFGDRLEQSGAAQAALLAFIHERLAGWLRERGFSAQEVAAVVDQRPDELAAVPARLQAVREFSGLPESQALAAANKRIGNLLRKAAADGAGAPAGDAGLQIDTALLSEPAERRLAATVDELAPQVDEALRGRRYGTALALMAQARNAVDEFFDTVMAMAEDPAVRANRLALLARLRAMMNRVADISKLSA